MAYLLDGGQIAAIAAARSSLHATSLAHSASELQAARLAAEADESGGAVEELLVSTSAEVGDDFAYSTLEQEAAAYFFKQEFGVILPGDVCLKVPHEEILRVFNLRTPELRSEMKGLVGQGTMKTSNDRRLFLLKITAEPSLRQLVKGGKASLGSSRSGILVEEAEQAVLQAGGERRSRQPAARLADEVAPPIDELRTPSGAHLFLRVYAIYDRPNIEMIKRTMFKGDRLQVLLEQLGKRYRARRNPLLSL